MELITNGVPRALIDTFTNYEDAAALYTLASSQEHVHQIVEIGDIHDHATTAIVAPCRRHLSGTSSIWDKVSDIDDIAANWSG